MNLTPEVLVKAYIDIRNRRRDLSAQEKELTVKQDIIAGAIMRKMAELGQDGFSAAGHTVYRSNLTTTSVEDPELFLDFVKDNNEYGLLDVRSSKEACLRWRVDHAYQTPEGDIIEPEVPGIKVSTFERLGVRKAG